MQYPGVTGSDWIDIGTAISLTAPSLCIEGSNFDSGRVSSVSSLGHIVSSATI